MPVFGVGKVHRIWIPKGGPPSMYFCKGLEFRRFGTTIFLCGICGRYDLEWIALEAQVSEQEITWAWKGVWKFGVHTGAEQAHVIVHRRAILALQGFNGQQDQHSCAEEIISCRMTWSKLEFVWFSMPKAIRRHLVEQYRWCHIEWYMDVTNRSRCSWIEIMSGSFISNQNSSV